MAKLIEEVTMDDCSTLSSPLEYPASEGDDEFSLHPSAAKYKPCKKIDIWAAEGKKSIELTTAERISCYDGPDWTVHPIIGLEKSNESGYKPYFGLRMRCHAGGDLSDHDFQSEAQDRASAIFASRQWRAMAATVGDESGVPTLGHANELLRQLDTAVSEAQSELEEKARSARKSTFQTFTTGALTGITIGALAHKAWTAIRALSK